MLPTVQGTRPPIRGAPRRDESVRTNSCYNRGKCRAARRLSPTGSRRSRRSKRPKVEQRPRGTVWPIALPQRLPTIGIPLRAEDADFPLDLQQVLDAVYDRNNYDLEIDYRTQPTVSLSPEQAAWADALLREKGLRGGS